jgi:hypothetical protein
MSGANHATRVHCLRAALAAGVLIAMPAGASPREDYIPRLIEAGARDMGRRLPAAVMDQAKPMLHCVVHALVQLTDVPAATLERMAQDDVAALRGRDDLRSVVETHCADQIRRFSAAVEEEGRSRRRPGPP